MLQRGYLLAAALSLAGLCATPGLAPAGKGGGHGGGHAGGAHSGGAHMGGAHMGGAHMGNHNHNHSHSAVFFGYPFYGGFYGGLYPYGYGYGGAYGFGSNGYGSPIYGPRYAYYPPGGDYLQQAPVFYATIRVILPDAAARVWFDGNDTKQTGLDRYFYTPDLDPNGGPYSYRVRASWKVDGQDMTQERVVEVAPGQTSVADFR